MNDTNMNVGAVAGFSPPHFHPILTDAGTGMFPGTPPSEMLQAIVSR